MLSAPSREHGELPTRHRVTRCCPWPRWSTAEVIPPADQWDNAGYEASGDILGTRQAFAMGLATLPVGELQPEDVSEHHREDADDGGTVGPVASGHGTAADPCADGHVRDEHE